jgi:primosomal protein N' (replication factor Y)
VLRWPTSDDPGLGDPVARIVGQRARGRYERVALPRRTRDRASAVRLVDLRRALERGVSCPTLDAELGATFGPASRRSSSIGAVTRHPMPRLRLSRFECPSCTAWLVEHRFTGRSSATIAATPRRCRLLSRDASRQIFSFLRAGVERACSRRVADRFPAARAAVMVSDLLSGARAAARLAQAMTERRYDVLIGTQIVAKGHHFPMLTLVAGRCRFGAHRRRLRAPNGPISCAPGRRRPAAPDTRAGC